MKSYVEKPLFINANASPNCMFGVANATVVAGKAFTGFKRYP